MIKLQNYTPEVYYQQSRDFQYLGRLYDVVLNGVKTNADMIYDIPSSDAAGSKMIDLLALTLGFKSKHSYSVNQLAGICSIFPTILRYKGTKYAIDCVVRTLLSVEGIVKNYSIEKDVEDSFKWYVIVPLELSDINLLRDLLDYIIPAGISCEVTRATTETLDAARTTVYANTTMKYAAKYTDDASKIAKGEDIAKKPYDADSENPNGYDNGKYEDGFMVNSTIYKKPQTKN